MTEIPTPGPNNSSEVPTQRGFLAGLLVPPQQRKREITKVRKQVDKWVEDYLAEIDKKSRNLGKKDTGTRLEMVKEVNWDP